MLSYLYLKKSEENGMKKADYQKTGVIFNIQKFSLNDGPGIRTVVFLKGCPLRCKWCSNPESQLAKIQILWNIKRCINCHHCIGTCPQKAISIVNARIHINHSLCNGCKKCMDECSGRALSFEGEVKTVREIIDIVLQDFDFYEESGGGITLSGGEIFSQPEFAVELFVAAKEKGIHTCCETTGFTNFETFKSIIHYIDYILFDLKHWSNEKHKEGTGVSNDTIIQNMKYAVSIGKKILPRIPVIPNYNNSLEDALGFVQCLKTLGINKIQLLPFHQFGENKYNLLNKEYIYRDVSALHKENLKEFQQIFLNHEINAFF